MNDIAKTIPQNDLINAIFTSGNRIEGKTNQTITPDFIIKLCLAYVNSTNPSGKILLCMSDKSQDMMMKFSFLSGIIASGAECYNLVDCNDRAMAKFTLRKLSFDGGIYVQTNGSQIGIELLDSDGTPLKEDTINRIKHLLLNETYQYGNPNSLRSPVNVNDIPRYYFKDIVTTTPCKRLNFSIGICTQSSESKSQYKKIASAFGISLLFTNNPEFLPKLITENKLDFGLLIGENGKCAYYDEYGNVLSGDTFYALLTLIVLSAIEGETVLLPQHVSESVSEVAESCNGKIIRIDESLFEKKLLEKNTPASRLQHELCFDPIRSMIRLCEFLFLNQCFLSQVCSLLPDVYKIIRKVDCPSDKKHILIQKLISAFGKDKAKKVTNGYKIVDDHGWIIIMPEYSQSKIQIISESQDEEYAQELAGSLCKTIEMMLKD